MDGSAQSFILPSIDRTQSISFAIDIWHLFTSTHLATDDGSEWLSNNPTVTEAESDFTDLREMDEVDDEKRVVHEGDEDEEVNGDPERIDATADAMQDDAAGGVEMTEVPLTTTRS